MISDFEEAVNITLKNEGGLSDSMEDKGGVTKYGISLRFLQENGIDINKDGSINGKDIDDLTLDEAISIYKSQFWDKFNIGSITNRSIADKVFDLSVNMGGYESIKLLQEAVNSNLCVTQIKEDGILGYHSLHFINGLDPKLILNSYKNLASTFYKNLVEKNPKLEVFIEDWLKRANQ